MVRKRKRPITQNLLDPNISKKQKLEQPILEAQKTYRYPLLSLYYPNVSTLRDYLLSRLTRSSKSRRKKIASIPLWLSHLNTIQSGFPQLGPTRLEGLSKLVDTTLVGYSSDVSGTRNHVIILKDLEQFSQRLHSSCTSSLGDQLLTQSNVRIIDTLMLYWIP